MPPKQRIEAYKKYMLAQGIDKRLFAPAVWRVCWSLGIYLLPPPFMGVLSLALVSIIFGVPVGGVAWIVIFLDVLTWPNFHAPVTLVPLWWSIALASILMAVGNWIYYRRMARSYGLESWSTFSGVRQ